MIVSCSQRECSVINIASTDISDGLTHLRALLLVSPRVYVVYLPITSSNPRVSLSLSPLSLSLPRLLLDRGFINEPTSPYLLTATSVASFAKENRSAISLPIKKERRRLIFTSRAALVSLKRFKKSIARPETVSNGYAQR